MLSELDLHVTNRCTTSCNYCCFSSNRIELKEMSTLKIKKVIDEAKTMGVSHLHFTGGEPLIRSDIFDIISYANKNGFDMRLQTNGTLLTGKVAEKLYLAGLKSIMISLDSAYEVEHDLERGNGTWKKAVDAIKVAQKSKLSVRVNSVLTTTNVSSILETIRFVKSLGVTDYSAFYFSPIGSGTEHLEKWINPENYISFWEKINSKILDDDELRGMNIVIEKGYARWKDAKNINIKGFTGCGGGCENTYHNRDYLIVRCDGNVYPCILAIDSEPLGNLFIDSLKEIHDNAKVWEKLKRSNSNDCVNCEYIELCGGGCRYYPFPKINNRDARCVVGSIVPLCPIMKYNYKNNSFGGSSEDVME